MKSINKNRLEILQSQKHYSKKKPVLSTKASKTTISTNQTQHKKRRPYSQMNTISKSLSKTQQNSPNQTINNDLMMNLDKQKFSYNDNPDIDNEITLLYKKLQESKNNRQKSENDYSILTNKLQLLQNEESKIKVKENIYLKNQEKAQKIQFQNLEEKEKIFHAKMRLKEKINEIKSQNDKFREERDKYLKNWREYKAGQNNSVITKIKNERKTDYQRYLQRQEEEYNRKKNKIKEMHQHRALSAEMKKQEEYDKKLKIKMDLIKKIMNEEAKRKKLEEASTKVQNDTIELIGKIKKHTNNFGEENNVNNGSKVKKNDN